MQTRQFPFLALAFGIVLWVVSLAGADALPLLTRLVVAEFAFFVTAIGAFIAFREARGERAERSTVLSGVACAVLAIFFLLRGFALWPL